MKKIILPGSAFMLLTLAGVSGQLRHVRGVSNIGVTYGKTGNGSLFGAGYSHYLDSKRIWNINALYESGTVESTRLKNYTVNGGMDYTFLQKSDFLYLNAGLSVFSGLEKLTSDESADKITTFIFGPAGNINVEWYLHSRVLFRIMAEQYYSPRSGSGKWFPVYSISLKYCIH